MGPLIDPKANELAAGDKDRREWGGGRMLGVGVGSC